LILRAAQAVEREFTMKEANQIS